MKLSQLFVCNVSNINNLITKGIMPDKSILNSLHSFLNNWNLHIDAFMITKLLNTIHIIFNAATGVLA